MTLDYREADLSDGERAWCDFGVRLTLRPGEMDQADIDRLHDAGFDDGQITIATQVISYFNYINRIADALGVDVEPWMTMSKEQWLADKRSDWR